MGVRVVVESDASNEVGMMELWNNEMMNLLKCQITIQYCNIPLFLCSSKIIPLDF
jgi:hypothetical protein